MINYSGYKLYRIISSRFKKQSNQSLQRLKVCDNCKYNSKNISKISLKQKIMNLNSNLLTFITTGKFNKSKAACVICTCTLYFKAIEPLEYCEHPEEDKWKNI